MSASVGRGGRVAVIGLGRFGEAVALTSTSLGYDVIGIDMDGAAVRALSDELSLAVQGDGSSEELLKSVEVDRCAIAVIGTGEAVDASVLSTLVVKSLGVPFVVARATSKNHGRILQRVGADRVVFPEEDSGVEVAHSLAVPSIDDFMPLASNAGVAKLPALSRHTGRSISQSLNESGADVSILLIKRGSAMLANPRLDSVIEPGDILVVAGSDVDIEKFAGSHSGR